MSTATERAVDPPPTGSPSTRPLARRLPGALAGACAPLLGARLARRARAQSELRRADPVRGVIGFLADRPELGLSTTVALVAQILDSLAPGAVAVLDCDEVNQTQRRLRAADAGGDVPALLAAATTGHSRRLVDGYLAAVRPALLVAAGDRSAPALTVAEFDQATTVLHRRFPTVLVDVPFTAGWPAAEWLRHRCDQLVVLTADDGEPSPYLAALLAQEDRPGGSHPDVRAPIVVVGRATGGRADADVMIPALDRAPATGIELDARGPDVLAAVAELATRLTVAACPS